jgi:hypothetical protein
MMMFVIINAGAAGDPMKLFSFPLAALAGGRP